ncbi:hypothetical protein ACET3X_007161 [Alternaria dauci]|uniref:Uncharacterized protein n=1 Tax=Alternaria dauci TaxID=48095 RepID=A0ABR3UFS2_9PLEO
MPLESPYPKVTVPNADIWSYFLERSDRPYPDDHVLFVDVATNRKYTYSQLRSSAERFGGGLQQQWGWRKGDVLVIMTPNDIDIAPVILGTQLVGGIVCPLNFMYTVDELVSQLTSSKAKGLVTNAVCLDVAREAASKVGLPLDHILLVSDNKPTTTAVRHFSTLAGASSPQRVKIDPEEDLAYLVYSSGTTGVPKGVMLTHRNIIANIVQKVVGDGGGPDWKTDKSIGFIPMYHIYGIAALISAPIYHGSTAYIMQGFDLPKFCETVQNAKITIGWIVPPVALALAKAPIVDQYDLSSLRDLHSSAAPAPLEILTAVHKRIGAPIRQAYGLSETAPAVTSQLIEEWDKPMGTSGRLLPNMSARLMKDGKEVEPGTGEGEVCLKGPNIFKGYHNNPEATAGAFDAEGWYHTGDVGRFDEHGNLFVTDRLKELIKYNGFQVAPAELEALLLGHPAVADVAVIGVYDASRVTELPRAYIVAAPGYKADKKLEDEIHEWFNKRVAPHKKLRGGIRFVEAVPKSNAGKILRRVLVDQAKAEEAEKTAKARL